METETDLVAITVNGGYWYHIACVPFGTDPEDRSPVYRGQGFTAYEYDCEDCGQKIDGVHPGPTADCTVCGMKAQWIDCPTGGWWAHMKHPADGHDAVTEQWGEGAPEWAEEEQ